MKSITKNSQGFGIVTLLIVIAAIVGVGGAGWYVWSQRQNENVNSSQSSNEESVPEGIEDSNKSSKKDVFEGVKLAEHVDSEWGFSFSYPASLRKSVNDGDNFPVSLYTYPESEGLGRGFVEGATDGRTKISFLLTSEPTTDNIDREIQRAFADDEILSIEKLGYENVNAAMVDRIILDGDLKRKAYYVLGNGIGIIVSAGGDVTTTDIYKTIEGIISTLQFQ